MPVNLNPYNSEPAIRGWKLKPPAGGWAVEYYINDEEFRFRGSSPQEIVRRLFEVAKINGAMSQIEEAWLYCNDIWAARSPDRSLLPKVRNRDRAAENIQKHKRGRQHASVSPKEYGPKVWNMLALNGMAGAFDERTWMACIVLTTNLLNPNHSPKTGCIECYYEWQAIVRNSPPKKVTSAEEAAEWVFNAHNRVNARLGKQKMSWRKAVLMHNWDVSL